MQKQYHLKSNGAFRYVYRKGKSVSNGDMVLLFAKSTRGLHIGFSVSKQVGNAVTRNRVKRLLRENFQKLIANEKIENDFTYVIVAKPNLASKSFQEIGDSLFGLLNKAGKLK